LKFRCTRFPQVGNSTDERFPGWLLCQAFHFAAANNARTAPGAVGEVKANGFYIQAATSPDTPTFLRLANEGATLDWVTVALLEEKKKYVLGYTIRDALVETFQRNE